jgi:hypothetical protein
MAFVVGYNGRAITGFQMRASASGKRWATTAIRLLSS